MKGGNRVSLGTDTFPNDGLPQPPETLESDERTYWDELLQSIPHELLRRADVHQLHTLCVTLALRDRLADAMRDDANDMRIVSKFLATANALARLSGMFGLSPVDRRRMKLEPAIEEENPIEMLLERMGGRAN